MLALHCQTSVLTSMANALADIIDDFALIEDWDERYRYLIELGRALQPLPDNLRTEANKVRGCASQVWIATETSNDNALVIQGDSDAHIVKGLVKLTLAIFDGLEPAVVLQTDASAIFGQLGLSQHLTPQRSNGVRAMVQRIRDDAQAAITQGLTTQSSTATG